MYTERILKDEDHDMWNTEAEHLYAISLDLRSALHRIGEEMRQMVFKAREGE